MSIPYYHVDAFAGQLFTGNPAGVCPLADWLPDDTLLKIAAENNLAETAFVVQRAAHCDLRWFAPAMEIDLCGHATLAAAHVLFRHLGFNRDTVQFQTRSGELRVDRKGEWFTLDFPSRAPAGCSAPAALLEGLGAQPQWTGKARDYIAVFESEDSVRTLRPKPDVLSQLDCLGVIVTAPGMECDFVSRFFAPRAGVPEDPVTGSAHCTLIPYWARRLGKARMRALQVSARGGELQCEDRGERVGIGGRAVTYSTGFILL